MALPDLAGYRVQVRGVLVDAGGVVWSDGSIDQALRQGLGDLARVYGGTAPAIKDLDGGTSTTVEAVDTSALVIGAAGYAARFRCVDLSEIHSMGDKVPPALINAAERLLGQYGGLLEMVRRRKLATSTAVPYTQIDEEDEDGL